MSFAINPSLSFIDVPQESIEEIYRSTAAIRLQDSGFRGYPCEAYICICKSDTEVRAYIALMETEMKTVFVYSPERTGRTLAEYAAVAAEAKEYLHNLGFTMERINLEFSKAMREVIIKGIRVMRPPAKKPLHRQMPAQTKPEPPVGAEPVMPARQEAIQAAEAVKFQEELSRDLADLRQKIEESQKSRHELEQLLSVESATARVEIERLNEENALLAANLEVEKAATASAREKIAAQALFEKAWKESQLHGAALSRDIDAMREEIATLQAEGDDARQKVADLQQRITGLETELGEATTEAATLRANGGIAESAAAEIKVLNEANCDLEHEYMRLANESKLREEELMEALYAADEEILRLRKELEASSKVAAAEQEALRSELQKITAVMTARSEEPASEAVITMPVAVAREAVVKAAEDTTAPKAADTEPLESAAAQELCESEVSVEEVTETMAAEHFADDPDTLLSRDPALINGLLNEFGSFFGNSGTAATEFRVNPSMSCIEYSHPGEVAALLYSSNSVQAMPDGKRSERCKAFAVVLNRSGSYTVQIAWYMQESMVTVVCSPDHQPVDLADCTSILQDAVSYFEIVGFMMEIGDLGESVGSALKKLESVPSLKRFSNLS